jgi:salicylate hydroxylase
VRVLERAAPHTGRRAGGVRVPPNLSKILVEWGLEDELMRSSIRCKGSTFNSLETGETVGYLEWNEDVMRETGGSFLLMHVSAAASVLEGSSLTSFGCFWMGGSVQHEDLHLMLHRLATTAGALIETGVGVKAVHASASGAGSPSVELESGESLNADVVIGADGYRSIVRAVVVGEEDSGEDAGMSVYTLVRSGCSKVAFVD